MSDNEYLGEIPDPPECPDNAEGCLRDFLGEVVVMSNKDGIPFATSYDDFTNNPIPNWRRIGQG